MNTTYTKDDVLTPRKFATKHNLSLQLLKIVLEKMHKEGVTVSAKPSSPKVPVVLRNRSNHRKNAFSIHPLGHAAVLARYAIEQEKMNEKIKKSTVALDAAIRALDKKPSPAKTTKEK